MKEVKRTEKQSARESAGSPNMGSANQNTEGKIVSKTQRDGSADNSFAAQS